MKFTDTINRAGKNLRQAKVRTLLTSLAIAVGAFTIMMSLAAGEGTRAYADKLLKSNINPQAIMVAKDKRIGGNSGGMPGATLNEYSEGATQMGGMNYKTLSVDEINKIAKIDGIKEVVPMYIVQAQYFQFAKKPDKKYTASVTAYDKTVLSNSASGEMPKLGSDIEKDEIVIPESYAEAIGKRPKELVGSELTLRLVRSTARPSDDEIVSAMMSGGQQAVAELFKPESKDVKLKIRAVSAKSATSFVSSSGLFISESLSKELSDYLTEDTDQYQRYITAVAIAKDGEDTAKIKSEIKKLDVGTVMTAEDMQGMIFTMVNTLQAIVFGFGVLALIASVFGIVNTQYISVLERTSQIGLMKALGASKRNIGSLFRYEAAWVGFLGGVIGILLAWVAVYFLNPWINTSLSLGEGNYLLIFNWLMAGLLLVGLIFVAIVAGWFPSRKASKLDPIEALRTE